MPKKKPGKKPTPKKPAKIQDRIWLSEDPADLFEYDRTLSDETGLHGLSQHIIDLVGNDIPDCAQSDLHVLITGETGTGKELVAQTIRKQAGTPDGKFKVVNCAEFVPELMASELFGYKKGAFTGAEKDKDGLIKELDGGVIFLDELGALSEDLQAHLLRVIQEHTFAHAVTRI